MGDATGKEKREYVGKRTMGKSGLSIKNVFMKVHPQTLTQSRQ